MVYNVVVLYWIGAENNKGRKHKWAYVWLHTSFKLTGRNITELTPGCEISPPSNKMLVFYESSDSL